MFARGKKTVSLAYKQKLLADIAHYEKRIEEALSRPQNDCIENESSDEETNPYTFNIRQSRFELKQQDADLSERASMTLELAMLTIMQSEVNVMVTPPEVRRPIQEEGIWLDVIAECKIDLVAFTITFYAHKPRRRFAPTRYRNVAVALAKPAHQQELVPSVLPKLTRPNLALQVLQSYASAFRSRRTTLLDLAEKYADKLRMEAMPGGGYRVKFLDLLKVEWTLENMWSPIVPFCHRMKFEVEYMPKDYIHAIGKLYKQFKDPSLETSERTHVLSKIFDTCLQARAPARELQDSLESDPDTAGRLHERRTTIDQEPDVPNVEQSPKKSKGKENKVHNRKTNMAPPNTIPKKVKKRNAKSNETRKGVKRGNEDDSSNNAKKSKSEGNVDNSKSKAGLKGGRDGFEEDTEPAVVAARYVKNRDADVNDGQRKNSVKVAAESLNRNNKVGAVTAEIDVKKGKGKSAQSKASNNSEGSSDTNICNKRKDIDNVVGNSKEKISQNSEVNPKKRTKKDDRNNDKDIVSSTKAEENTVSSKGNIANTKNNAKKVTNATTVAASVATSKHSAKKGEDRESVTASKNENAAIPKQITTKDDNVNSKGTGTASDSINTIRVNDTGTASKASSKTVTSKDDDAKINTAPKNLKDKNKEKGLLKKVTKETNVGSAVGKTQEVIQKTKTDIAKKLTPKDSNIDKAKEVVKNVNKINSNNKNVENNSNKETKLKEPESNNKIAKNDKNKETVLNPAEKNKIINPKSAGHKPVQVNNNNKTTVVKTTKTKVGSDVQTTNKNDGILPEKRVDIQPSENINNKNNDKQSKKTTTDKSDKTKSIVPEPDKTNILKEKTNRDETIQRVVDKNKINKNNVTITKPNNQKNLLNVTVTKSKNSQISKLPTEDQIKLADKMKTKIPMMKNKMKFSTLKDKILVNNIGRISKGVEKPKTTQKNLPVFKKVVNNVPTRISPRKLPSTFKKPSHGSNK